MTLGPRKTRPRTPLRDAEVDPESRRLDVDGVPLQEGDRVHVVNHTGNTPDLASEGTVVGFGRLAVYVQWDGYSYSVYQPHHATPRAYFVRRISTEANQ